jgi:outer membrane protein OmpA-like peptidoglycan-associated protein
MTTNDVRAADEAHAYTRKARVIVIVLLILLALLWLLGYGPGRTGCCSAPAPVAAPPVAVAPQAVPAPAPAPAPASAPSVPVVDCVALLKAVDVEFLTGSANLTETGRSSLDGAISCLGKGSYEVGGHTDSSGNALGNQRLSLARAQAARAYLIEKGIAAERLVAHGYGASQPIASNASEDGRAQNRRIAFTAR